MTKTTKRGVKFGEFGTQTQDQARESVPDEMEPSPAESDFEYEYGWVREALRDIESEPSDSQNSLAESSEMYDAGIEASIELESVNGFENEIDPESIDQDEFSLNEAKSSVPRSINNSSNVNRRLKLMQKLRESIVDSQ